MPNGLSVISAHSPDACNSTRPSCCSSVALGRANPRAAVDVARSVGRALPPGSHWVILVLPECVLVQAVALVLLNLCQFGFRIKLLRAELLRTL